MLYFCSNKHYNVNDVFSFVNKHVAIYTFILTQVMNIHVTGCLLNNDNFHKTMKIINVYANDKCQKPKKYFHKDRLPEKIYI